MKKLEDYSQEELIALYQRISVYAVTWWIKYSRMYKMKPEEKDSPFIQSVIDRYTESEKEGTCIPRSIRWANLAHIDFVQCKIDKIERAKGADNTGCQILIYEKSALTTINQCLYWLGGEHDYHVECESEGYDYCMDKLDDFRSVDDMECELHMNDQMCVHQGVATDYQVYEFVWNTLQYLNIEELSRLLKFAETGLENKWTFITASAGRKSRNSDIKQIDLETGKVVNTFQTRNELIDKLGIKKSHLSQCIKTSNDNPDNTMNWKKWIGNDGKKYGFVEHLVN